MFICPVSIKLNDQEHLEFLVEKLIELGYHTKSLCLKYDFNYPYLVTNYLEGNSRFNIGSKGIQTYNRTLVQNNNTFLALATMTNEEAGSFGEYWIRICEGNSLFLTNKLSKQSNLSNEPFKLIDKNGNSQNIFKDIQHKYFRKATKEEIINWFKGKNMETKKDNSSIQSLTLGELKELYIKFDCSTWKAEIKKLIEPFLFKSDINRIVIPISLLYKLKSEGSEAMIKAVEELNIELENLFDASMLKEGEMMRLSYVIGSNSFSNCKDQILIKRRFKLVFLTGKDQFSNISNHNLSCFIGEKLPKGFELNLSFVAN